MKEIMKDNITRRRFLKVVGITVATPSVIKGLLEQDDKIETPSSRPVQKKGKLDERLEWISVHWEVSKANFLGVEGWNESGFWSSYHDLDTGRIIYGFFSDYRGRPFKNYDVGFSEPRTLAQLRADGVPWKEINRLHHEGFSNNPGYKFLS